MLAPFESLTGGDGFAATIDLSKPIESACVGRKGIPIGDMRNAVVPFMNAENTDNP